MSSKARTRTAEVLRQKKMNVSPSAERETETERGRFSLPLPYSMQALSVLDVPASVGEGDLY